MINTIEKTQLLVFLLTAMLLFSCTEEINFKTESFESALVIEATITNELKFQEVILSRTFMFEEEGPNPESNAEVSIEIDNAVILFHETEQGTYVSEYEFKAEENLDYTLKITTSNGRQYSSTPTNLTQNTQIDQVYALRETDDLGLNGMAIYLDSYDPISNSKYYRYEYEETYKIIAPLWVEEELTILDESYPCTVELGIKDPADETQICYNTVSSLNINQTNTTSFTEDRVTKHLIRFINSENYILSHRYSILVKQFIQSQQAYTYYETLNNFTEEGSLFSQTQPGFFSGNVFSENNPSEKVIGFFDVSTVSSKRIFFNYTDYYPDEALPPFPINCVPTDHDQFTMGNPPACGPLITESVSGRIIYHSGASKILPPFGKDSIVVGPFLMLLKPCGDCNALGNNQVPDFWED